MGLTYKRGIYPRGTTCETLVRHQTLSEPDGCRGADRSFDQTYPSDQKSNGLTVVHLERSPFYSGFYRRTHQQKIKTRRIYGSKENFDDRWRLW